METKPSACVYCGLSPAVTQDHVPPKSFFPKPRPANLITVPACRKCNEGSGKDEELFLATFMFTDAGVTDVGKKLWDEKLHRMYKKNLGLRKRIASSLREVDLRTPGGIHLGRRLTIRHYEARSGKVIRKIVRGLYYYEYHEMLSSSVEIITRFVQRPEEISAVEPLAPMLRFGTRGWQNIFEYRFNRVAERPENSFWVIRFFGKVVFWAISSNKKGAR